MKDWRGVIVQLASLFSAVAIVAMSKIADPHIVSMALGVIGAGVGQSLARARLDAGSNGPTGSGRPGSSLPPMITTIALFSFFYGASACAYGLF